MFHRHKHTTPTTTAATGVTPVVPAAAFVPVAPAPPPPLVAVPVVPAASAPPAPPVPSTGAGLSSITRPLRSAVEKVAHAAQNLATPSATHAPAPAFTTTTLPAAAPILREEPVQFQREERPVVVKERILPLEEESIQPVIHREVERREIHEVIQPFHERQVLPASIEERQLPAEVRPSIGGYVARTVPLETGSVEYGSVERTQFVRPPIIEETIRRTVIEEVQPVVYRETVRPHIIRQTQPIYEKILEPEVIIKETRPLIETTGYQSIPAAPMMQQTGRYVFDVDTRTKVIPHTERLGMQSGLGQTGFGQSGYQSGMAQPGLSSGGFTSGMGQQGLSSGYQSGMAQPGLSSGGFSSGMGQAPLDQTGLGTGISQSGSFGQTGLGQSGFGQSGLGVKEGLLGSQGMGPKESLVGGLQGTQQGLGAGNLGAGSAFRPYQK